MEFAEIYKNLSKKLKTTEERNIYWEFIPKDKFINCLSYWKIEKDDNKFNLINENRSFIINEGQFREENQTKIEIGKERGMKKFKEYLEECERDFEKNSFYIKRKFKWYKFEYEVSEKETNKKIVLFENKVYVVNKKEKTIHFIEKEVGNDISEKVREKIVELYIRKKAINKLKKEIE